MTQSAALTALFVGMFILIIGMYSWASTAGTFAFFIGFALAAAGGYSLKLALFGALTMLATGVVLLAIPAMAGRTFSDTLSQPLQQLEVIRMRLFRSKANL
jgi:hypothetical protein